MSACTFFGHRDCPEKIDLKLKNVLINLIENKEVNKFYVGNQGAFDYKVCLVLSELKKKYKNIKCYTVLAYMPKLQITTPSEMLLETILPDGIEKVPPKFAISWRNKWMLKHSDYVITYITRPFGGAAQYSNIAEKHGNIVINIAD